MVGTRWTLAGAAMVLMACGGDPGRPERGPVESLTGPTWALTAFRGDAEAAVEGEVTITFVSDSTLAGTAGCNRYFGGYRAGPDSLVLSQVGSTMMACPQALMAQETRYLSALNRITVFEIRADTLVLHGPTGPELSFVRVPSSP